MPLVQRTRFITLVKALTGFRGPMSINVDSGITPTYDFSAWAPELDSEKAFWFTGPVILAASAANFSSFTVKCTSGKALVTAIYIRAQAAIQTYVLGMAAEIAGGGSGSVLANDFNSNRVGTSFSVQAQQFGPVTITTRQTAASLFGSNQIAFKTQVAANAPDFFAPLPFPWVISPGWALGIETGAVNQAAEIIAAGTWLGDQT